MVNRLSIWTLVLLGLAGCTKATPVEEISVPAGTTISDTPTPEFAPEDWPWWRGPERNGHSQSESAPLTWSESENIIWKTAVPGRGHSSPTVVGDRIFLATADETAQTQSLLAFDRATGDSLWETQLSQGGFPTSMHQNSTHANGTVACDGERLFIALLHHDQIHVYAVSLEGERLWDVTAGGFASTYGYAPSPLVYKSVVIIAADNRGGGYLAAIDRETGDLIWRKQRPVETSFSSPVVATVGGRDLLVISGCDLVAAYDPASGDEVWTCQGTTSATCGTAVWDGERFFASGGYPGAQTISVDAASGQEVWSTAQKCYEQSMLVHDGLLFAVTNNGTFCWNSATGAEQWRGRTGGRFSASPVLAGGNIYAVNEAGTCFVFKADGAAFELVAENELGSEAFATPTICGGRIYMRVAERVRGQRQEVLYCIGDATETGVGG